MANKKTFDLNLMSAASKGAENIETPKVATEEPKSEMKKKNVFVNTAWAAAYAELPEPKIAYSHFCTQAIETALKKAKIIK